MVNAKYGFWPGHNGVCPQSPTECCCCTAEVGFVAVVLRKALPHTTYILMGLSPYLYSYSGVFTLGYSIFCSLEWSITLQQFFLTCFSNC